METLYAKDLFKVNFTIQNEIGYQIYKIKILIQHLKLQLRKCNILKSNILNVIELTTFRELPDDICIGYNIFSVVLSNYFFLQKKYILWIGNDKNTIWKYFFFSYAVLVYTRPLTE